MNSVSNSRVKVISSLGAEIKKLGNLFPQLNSIDFINKPGYDKIDLDFYHRVIMHNRKQKQSNMVGAGLNRVVISPGTNKGRTRQKYASFGYKSEVSNAPNNRKGRVALAYMKNQTPLKINKKMKKQIIKKLILETLKKADLYMLDMPSDTSASEKALKTSAFLKLLVKQAHAKLRVFLKEPYTSKGTNSKARMGPVLLTDDRLARYFSNYSNVLNLKHTTNFFGLYQGARLRSSLVFTKEVLTEFLKNHIL